jgi:hypothetical protein
MPAIQDYIAEVTVSVVLRTVDAGVVAEYSVTRKAEGAGTSHKPGGIIDTATSAAAAGARIMGAGIDNAEARRLK